MNISSLRPLRVGILFALLTLLYGFGLGMSFGIGEESIKDHLHQTASAAPTATYGEDEALQKKVEAKSWVYMKRAHLHANGLGTSALALMLLLAFLPATAKLKTLGSSLLGVGALGYSSFWMFAGLRAPALGSTGAAKEALTWLAGPSALCCALGLLLTVGLCVHGLFITKDDKVSS